MKLITFATIEEAQSSLNLFSAKSIHTGLFTSDIGLIAITGIGPYAAHIALTQIPLSFTSVINIGLAGALNPTLELGSIHQISTCKKHLWHPSGLKSANASIVSLLPELPLSSLGLRLTTVDFPLYTHPPELKATCDLIDMEGYGIASACTSLKKDCQIYKLISDHCTSQSLSQIKNNLSHYSFLIATFLETFNYEIV